MRLFSKHRLFFVLLTLTLLSLSSVLAEQNIQHQVNFTAWVECHHIELRKEIPCKNSSDFRIALNEFIYLTYPG